MKRTYESVHHAQNKEIYPKKQREKSESEAVPNVSIDELSEVILGTRSASRSVSLKSDNVSSTSNVSQSSDHNTKDNKIEKSHSNIDRTDGALVPYTNAVPSSFVPFLRAFNFVPSARYLSQSIAETLFPRLLPEAQDAARRLYIGGLPQGTTDLDVCHFFHSSLPPSPSVSSGSDDASQPPVVRVEMAGDLTQPYRYCFVYFRHERYAVAALALDTAPFTNRHRATGLLKVRKVKNAPEDPMGETPIPCLAYVAGLPVSEGDKNALVEMFSDPEIGNVQDVWFLSAGESSAQNSGCAFFLYDTPEGVKNLIAALDGEEWNGIALHCRVATHCDRWSTVQRNLLSIPDGLLRLLSSVCPPSILSQYTAATDRTVASSASLICAEDAGHEARKNAFLKALLHPDENIEGVVQRYFRGRRLRGPTRVLVLLNLVDESELDDDEDFENLREDIESELETYGCLEELIITRYPPKVPTRAPESQKPLAITDSGEKGTSVPLSTDETFDDAMEKFFRELKHPVRGAVGRAFAVYRTSQEATLAQQTLSGRRFNGRTVICSLC